MMDLYDWYTDPAYDTAPEIKGIKEAREGLTACFVGDYAAAALAPHIEADTTAYAQDQEVLERCEQRRDGITYRQGGVRDVEGEYETVVSAYNALHHREDVEQAVQALLDAKADSGVLIILEADPDSEFIQVLDRITPEPTRPLEPLIHALEKRTSYIEHTIESSYTFHTQEHFTDYLAKELLVHEDKSAVRERVRKQYQETVGERVAVFVCQ